MHRVLMLFATLLFFVGCASKNNYDNLKTVTIESVKPALDNSAERQRLGIAFGGGGVRGFMHLGVMKALEEAGIRADVVVGTSSGSIAAALYATGMPYAEIEAQMLALDENDITDFVLSSDGVVNGKSLAEWSNSVTGNRTIESMPTPLGIAVTDLTHGKPMLLVEGNVGEAIQASSSVPGAFVPVESNAVTFVDGGILSLVPVRFTRAMGADVVLAVDIYCGSYPAIDAGAIDTLLATMRLQSCQLSAIEAAEADILLRPRFEPKDPQNFDSRDEAIAVGYAATKAILLQLRTDMVPTMTDASNKTGVLR